MRVLVIGAGVAGLSLSARLCQQGRPPVIIDRSDDAGGYALGLYPFGTSVLHGVGAYRGLLDRGHIVERYQLRDGNGRVLQELDMSRLTGAVGPMVMVDRAALIELLEATCVSADLRRGMTIRSLAQDGDGVDVELDDGSTDRFEAVVGADGISSACRHELFGPASHFDSGWTLYTWWVPDGLFDPTVVQEWWGRGWMFGAYPAPGRVMCAAGGPTGKLSASDPTKGLRDVVRPISSAMAGVAAALTDAGQARPWLMRDARARTWVNGRVALCGDAAVGFLPTAGVGASNAMRAAAGLADELSRADASTVPLALELYERRCRKLAEANQSESRRLARFMFMTNRQGAWLRDQIARHYPPERLLAQIISSSQTPF